MPPLLVLLGAFAFTLLGTPVARRLAWRTGQTATPSPVRHHERPTPLLGGLAIYAAVMLALGLLAGRTAPAQLAGILGGASMVALLGMLDDRRPIAPLPKLLAESLAALALVATGVHVELIGGPLIPWLPVSVGLWDALLTLLWVVAVTNAANLMDNMDGVLGGVVMVASTAFMLLAVGSDQLLVAPLAAALAGASLGFLVYNFNPASIFMGDGGSLFLGFILAAVAIKLRFPGVPTGFSWMVPVLVLALPLFDTALVVISRIRRGVNPLTTGGKDHLSHRLVARGASEREAAMGIWILASAGAALGAYVRHGGRIEAFLALVIAIGLALWGLWSFELKEGALRMLPPNPTAKPEPGTPEPLFEQEPLR
jgi:UDP-GlcNAc:undecaprenyl-phosphate GlcNAc-1-phosphate transferase